MRLVEKNESCEEEHDVCIEIRRKKKEKKKEEASKNNIESEIKEIEERVKWRDGEVENDDDSEDIKVFGNVELNEDERRFLSKPPDHALYGSLSEENMRVEIEIGLAKLRMGRRNKDITDEEHIDNDVENEVVKEDNELEKEKIDLKLLNKIVVKLQK